MDVRSQDGIDAAVGRCEEELGPVDVLFAQHRLHQAGRGARPRTERAPRGRARRHQPARRLAVREGSPLPGDGQGARSSINHQRQLTTHTSSASPHLDYVSAAKHGIISLTKALRARLRIAARSA